LLTRVDHAAKSAPPRFPVPVPKMRITVPDIPESNTGGERQVLTPR